jgi:DMSO/TMAO reductase YedYZ molybdopterin-dependent catalytic subunit
MPDAPPSEPVSLAELQLATRNHGLPLEALRYPITPVGLHYLLIHYDIPAVDAAGWRLEIAGEVDRPCSLSLEDLRGMPHVELVATLECAGNGRARLSPRPVSQPWLLEAVGTARWGGVPLRAVLERAGLGERAREVLFTGLDRGVEAGVAQAYERALAVEEALRDEVVLVYEMNGAPLLPQHGFPLRLVVPGWYAMTIVKWLGSITVLDHPFTGFQHTHSYRFRLHEDDEGTPLTRMQPRALMVPPGVPEFLTRERIVRAAPVTLEGRAWSGWARVASVQVSVDDGATWAEAELHDDAGSPWAWRGWTFDWSPAAGRHVVSCRAIDAAGNGQPIEPVWNVGGYTNNAVQRVVVNVG